LVDRALAQAFRTLAPIYAPEKKRDTCRSGSRSFVVVLEARLTSPELDRRAAAIEWAIRFGDIVRVNEVEVRQVCAV
jgi:hypothetical protein